MAEVMKHLEQFRQLSRLYLNMMIFINKESVSSSVVEHLYFNREFDTLPASEAIRYRVIKDSIIA